MGPCRLERRAECHPFQALAQAIAHQQLNGTAANTILKRFIDALRRRAPSRRRRWCWRLRAQLRAAGFSFAKVAALRDLADKTLAAVVPEQPCCLALGDEEIITRLTQVRGIGRWTVEMMLMFRLGRPDVLPVDDFGVRSGFRAAYGLRTLPRPQALAAWGERWRPYRSTAAWYLWRALELERAGQLQPPAQRVRLPRVRRQAASGGCGRRAARDARRARAAPRHLRRSSSAPPRRSGGRSCATSPPSTAISRTRLEEMNVNCSWGVRNTVSNSRSRWRDMLASWNSNSKSDTARSPRTITAPG